MLVWLMRCCMARNSAGLPRDAGRLDGERCLHCLLIDGVFCLLADDNLETSAEWLVADLIASDQLRWLAVRLRISAKVLIVGKPILLAPSKGNRRAAVGSPLTTAIKPVVPKSRVLELLEARVSRHRARACDMREAEAAGILARICRSYEAGAAARLFCAKVFCYSIVPARAERVRYPLSAILHSPRPAPVQPHIVNSRLAEGLLLLRCRGVSE